MAKEVQREQERKDQESLERFYATHFRLDEAHGPFFLFKAQALVGLSMKNRLGAKYLTFWG